MLSDVAWVGAEVAHAAELSSAGSMSVCTTSGLRSSEPLNRQRLFVVCHKAATEDMLARLFRTWPGLEYLDLKRDRSTGARWTRSRCWVVVCQHLVCVPTLSVGVQVAARGGGGGGGQTDLLHSRFSRLASRRVQSADVSQVVIVLCASDRCQQGLLLCELRKSGGSCCSHGHAQWHRVASSLRRPSQGHTPPC